MYAELGGNDIKTPKISLRNDFWFIRLLSRLSMALPIHTAGMAGSMPRMELPPLNRTPNRCQCADELTRGFHPQSFVGMLLVVILDPAAQLSQQRSRRAVRERKHGRA